MKYKFADTVFNITLLDDRVYNFFKGYETEEQAEYDINITKEMVDEAEEFGSVSMRQILLVLKYVSRYLLENKSGILFHSSAIDVGGKGVLFTALSGTGKSTHARHWVNVFGDEVSYVNDDKPFARLEGEKFFVYGSPWNGKHRLSNNKKVEIKAICFLKRGEVDRVEPITPNEAIKLFFLQTIVPEEVDLKLKLFAILDKMMRNVKLYTIYCTNSDESAKIIRKGINI